MFECKTKNKDMFTDFRKDPVSQTVTVNHEDKIEVVDEFKYIGTTTDSRSR